MNTISISQEWVDGLQDRVKNIQKKMDTSSLSISRHIFELASLVGYISSLQYKKDNASGNGSGNTTEESGF